MIVIIIGAVMTAVVTLILLRPLAKEGRYKEMAALSVLIPALALGLYLWLGHPDLPSAPALFETSGPRAERRALVAQELTLMQALSEDPGNIRLMGMLGDTQMKEGHLDEAVRILEQARDTAPKNHDVLMQLGAAYYAQGIKLLIGGNKDDARPWLDKAFKTAPGDAPYRSRLVHDMKTEPGL